MSEPGAVLSGRYRIDEALGRGGMAEVWRGRDTVLERDVAVKILLDRMSPAVADALLREARSMARLNHPSIVAVYDAAHDRDRAYIVMELVRGRTLDKIPPAEVTLRGALTWFIELLDALAYAHAAGVIHRDLKPANLMVLESGRLKVADFGLSRREDADSMSVAAGEIAGTVAYLAPERFLGQVADARSDLYSVGCVLYEVLTGRVPFRSEGEDLVAVIYQHVHDEPKRPREINRTVPVELERIALRLLAKDPEDRYPDATTAADDLRALLRTPPGRPSERIGVAAPRPGAPTTTRVTAEDPALRAMLEQSFGRQRASREASASALTAMLAARKGEWTESARAYREALRAFEAAENHAEWAKAALGYATMILRKNTEPGARLDRDELGDAAAKLSNALPVLRGHRLWGEVEEGERLLYALSRRRVS